MKRLASVQSLALGEEPFMVDILVDTISQGPHGYHCITMHTILFDAAKDMVRKVTCTKLVLMDLNLQSYLDALLVAALYKAGDAIRVP